MPCGNWCEASELGTRRQLSGRKEKEAEDISSGKEEWDFPSGPVVGTPPFPCGGHGLHPWSRKFRMPWDVAKNK